MSASGSTFPFPARLRTPLQFDPVLLTIVLTLLFGGYEGARLVHRVQRVDHNERLAERQPRFDASLAEGLYQRTLAAHAKQTGLREPVDELGADVGGERLRLVLQPVARADVGDRGAHRERRL